VIGVADVTIAGGNVIDYNRFDGPTQVNLVFTHVAMCEDVNPIDVVDSAIIEGDFTISPDGLPAEPMEHLRIDFSDYGGFY
jgi:hypothetical protein